MNASPELAWQRMPLTGTTLVEASAGTGKTYNIALMVLRLLLERPLTVRQILVTTFTEAAADELKARIRQRLLSAERLASALAAGTAVDSDGELAAYLGARLAADGGNHVLATLRLALADIDLAPISTIHSFCRRVLTDFPFDTGVAFTLGEVVDEGALVRECVEDFWRRCFLSTGVDPWYAALVLPDGIDALSARVHALIDASHAQVLYAPTEPLREWWQAFISRDHSALRSAVAIPDAFKNAGASRLLKGLRSLVHAADIGDPAGIEWSLLVEGLEPGKLAGAWKQSSTRPFIQRAEFRELMAARELFASASTVFRQEAARRCATFVRNESNRRLRARGLSTFSQWIDEVHDRLHGVRGDVLAARLAEAWPAALIDEFQDTDARQWAIFQRLYSAADTTLVLIGDPKQAIYAFRGGDIHTYLAARARLPAERVYSIQRNFRSHPDLLAALNQVYADAGAAAFGASGIEYLAVSAGRPERFSATAIAQPLRVRLLRCATSNLAVRDALALAACADDIAHWLNDPALRIGDRCIEPGDIAVLCDTNHQIRQLRKLLIARGVPVVGAGRAHVLATPWAEDLQLLLHALLHPGDESAVRGALATRLLGATATSLQALTEDPAAWDRVLDGFADWRLDWERRGILAVIESIIVEQAPRLLAAAAEGERALTDLRHLGEVLQHAASEHYGPGELYQWFVQARRDGAEQHEAAREMQLRIESETRRVQLLTIHASKGLQFALVFLPLAWRFRSLRPNDVARVLARFHDPTHRSCVDLGSADLEMNQATERTENLQERMRQLYVALTRAEHALQLYAFDDLPVTRDSANTARGGLDVLLGAALCALPVDDANARWQGLADRVPTLRLEQSGPATTLYRAPPALATGRLARTPLPAPRDAYGLYSFSALTRTAVADNEGQRGAEDEGAGESTLANLEAPPHPLLLALERVKGPRFGDAVHQLLEAGPGELPYAQQPGRIAEALVAQAVRLAPETAGADLAAIAGMLDRTLHTALAPGLSLGGLAGSARRAEFEFAFALDGARWGQLHGLLALHGCGEWWPQVDHQRELRGLMKGYVDLVFAWDGRYHVLDYKTNFLGTRSSDYRGASLDSAMREHHYGLQALIYSVALHRYLGRRLDDYDPQRHLGESWYLFVRALGIGDDCGLWRRRFEVTLIRALDALFDGVEIGA